MESSTEEEEEEFFETLEDILSSPSDAESVDEDKQHSKGTQAIMGRASNGSEFSFSRYEVWTSNPGSIFERRQRLLTQMGLKVERVDPDREVVLLHTPPPIEQPSALLASTMDVKKVENGAKVSLNHDSHTEVRPEAPLDLVSDIPETNSTWTMVRSRSDGTFSRLQGGVEAEDTLPRLVRSDTNSPVLPHKGQQDRLLDGSGAVLRTGSSGSGNQASKPPLGVKRSGGPSTSADRMVSGRSPFSWGKLERFKIIIRNGSSLNHSSVHDTVLMTDAGVLPNDDCGEVLCRIKDLDSGREFVVNEVGKDGLWNKLKDIDTGRELTLEEFENSLGLSPIVQELMRREREAVNNDVQDTQKDNMSSSQKKKKGWLKVIKGVVRGSRDKRSRSYHESGSDDKEASTEKSERKSGSATDDSQDAIPQVTKRIKVHAHKKSVKEFADLHLRQEIQAHQGAIWTMKFSLDGAYLASAGQDRVVRVWEVIDHGGQARDSPDISGELNDKCVVENLPQTEAKRSGKSNSGRKNTSSIRSRLPRLFLLSGVSKCTFRGHTEDILDLSWSPSQSLLSSSMDKTVRLWNVSSRECLRVFAHNDYVTCIQFNPINDGYFISGSLDGKVRIWSTQERQVVDWADLREMVTAACYTPDGQKAVVGSYKGTCRLYKTSGHKLQLDSSFDVRNRKNKRSHGKKITGFQFIPGDEEKILITSSDSRIRVYDGTEICSKYKGFRNSKSHISATCSSTGKYIVCASEDSRVCIWNYHDTALSYSVRKKGISGSYEDFNANRHVLVAIPWPGTSSQFAHNPRESNSSRRSDASSITKKDTNTPERKLVDGDVPPVRTPSDHLDLDRGLSSEPSSFKEKTLDGSSNLMAHEKSNENVAVGLSNESRSGRLSGSRNTDYLLYQEKPSAGGSVSTSILDTYLEDCCGGSIFSRSSSTQQVGSHGFFSDSRGSATWPEEKLPSIQQSLDDNSNTKANDPDFVGEESSGKKVTTMLSAWGFVIATAGLEGEIQIFQNYSLPVRL